MKFVVIAILACLAFSQSSAQSIHEVIIPNGEYSSERFQSEQEVIGLGLGVGYQMAVTDDCNLMIYDRKSTLYAIPASSIDVRRTHYSDKGVMSYRASDGEWFAAIPIKDGERQGDHEKISDVDLITAGLLLGMIDDKDVVADYPETFSLTVANWVRTCTTTAEPEIHYWLNYSSNAHNQCSYNDQGWTVTLNEAAEQCGYNVARVTNSTSNPVSKIGEAFDFESSLDVGDIAFEIVISSLLIGNTCSTAITLDGYYFVDGKFKRANGYVDHQLFAIGHGQRKVEQAENTIKEYISNTCRLGGRK